MTSPSVGMLWCRVQPVHLSLDDAHSRVLAPFTVKWKRAGERPRGSEGGQIFEKYVEGTGACPT